ncbi:MAG: hypothetical protein ACREOK_00545 [Gemmatimonadaceae bacterium]
MPNRSGGKVTWKNAVRPVAEFQPLQARETAGEQPGAGEHHQRQRELRCDEPRACTAPRARFASRPGAEAE